MMASTIERPLGMRSFEVLVVDGDPATAAVLRDAVRELALLLYVPDAYQALYELTAHRFDVVVMELFLPGASGVDLLQRMRAKGLHVPTIVLTQASRSYAEFDLLGVQHVLHKPASPDRFLAALTSVLAPSTGIELMRRTDLAAA